MTEFKVTRAHLHRAFVAQNWDLLDKLLEMDSSKINDNALFTDTWGEWWGFLLEAVYNDAVDGVRVLLKHGADRTVGNWGDCIPITPLEAAHDNPVILALLQNERPPEYTRQTDPPLPTSETAEDAKINRQGEIRDQAGLVFPTDGLE